jgi:hypothetical protein
MTTVTIASPNFGEKSKLWKKVQTLEKSPNFGKKSKLWKKSPNFGEKSKRWRKVRTLEKDQTIINFEIYYLLFLSKSLVNKQRTIHC